MRIMLSNAFLSIVTHAADPATLAVRARRAGDIEAVFGGGFQVITLSGHAYPFRAFIPRRIVADTIATHVFHINYGKFQDSVADASLHDAYMKVCEVMEDLQAFPTHDSVPHSGYRSL